MSYNSYRESGMGTKNSHHHILFNYVYAAKILVNLMTLSHARPKESALSWEKDGSMRRYRPREIKKKWKEIYQNGEIQMNPML